METNQSYLKQSNPKISEDILDSYLPADNYCVINEDDQALHPVYIKMPECPPLHTIDGYGLHASDQKFIRQVMPPRLIEIQNRFDTIDEIWNELDENAQEYQLEIKWIKLQWHRFFFGYWCFINGKPTYFVGWNYIYLNFWKFLDGGFPEFRDRNRKFFHGLFYSYKAKEVPIYEDEIILVYREVEVNGVVTKIPATKDIGSRVLFGATYPKNRRDGATNMCLCAEYCETIVKPGVISGIISMNGKSAQDHYSEILVPGWQGMPFFFKPIHDGFDNPEDAIKFFAPKKKGQFSKIQKQLRSKITWSNTAQSTGYDRSKIHFMLLDEGGKCFGKDTLIRMFDGSVKLVQNVKSGDIIMGNDSTKRIASGITKGQEILYEIVPKKGKPFICNESHILSLVFMDLPFKYKGIKYKLGDVINISVKEYLSLSYYKKKTLGIYRNGWELKEQEHVLDPYFLGLWLGDGYSRDSSITNIDNEILDYIKEVCNKFSLFLKRKSDGISYHLSCGKVGGFNPIKKELIRLNLIMNKHIPENYLYDSRKNRLQLLAGLLDTDGSLVKNTSTQGTHKCFEIIQKNDSIAKGIHELATSLGFYTSINIKDATMRRMDNSIYRKLVYRISIYGDIDLIPTKVKRKIAVVSRTKNRRNPLKSGFNITEKGIGDYYGFTVDENHLFLLADGTVVHNTVETNVDSRHQILKNCVSQGNGSVIGGFMMYPSTVGEMKAKGGAHYFSLCQKSHWERRGKVGQTISGLMNIFFKSEEGLEGFVDPYGNSVVHVPTPQQIKAAKREKNWEDRFKYAVLGMGARQYLEDRRKSFLDSGDMDGYNEEVRLFPQSFAEAFRTEDGDIGFNTKKLNDRIDELKFIFKTKVRRGNFKWEDNIRDSRVIWEDDEKGRWYRSKVLDENESNQKYRDGEDWFPINPKFTSSSDTFKLNKKNVQGKRFSDGGGSVFWDYDASIDGQRDIKNWLSHRFVCTYNNRPDDRDDYCEDMLMMSVYFGAMMYPENNLTYVHDWFTERGYAGYLKYDWDTKAGKFKNNSGFNSGGESKQDLFNEVRDYIERHVHREVHLDLLMECKSISGIEDMTNWDLFTAGAGSLKGSKSKHTKFLQYNAQKVDISNYLQKRVYN